MIASLPMYDWAEIKPVTDRLWTGIRDRLRGAGIEAPNELTRGIDMWDSWHDPDLLVSQTCGFPYRTKLHDKVTLVGTPDFALPDAPPGYYYSVLVTRADRPGDWTDFLDRPLAINGYDSQSGWAAPMNHAATIGRRFTNIMPTGAHVESARAVAESRADIAAIDAVTWRLVQAFRPEIASKLRVATRTEPTPGLPLITAPNRDPAPIATAVRAAIAAMPPADRSPLGLSGLIDIPDAAYFSVPIPKQ